MKKILGILIPFVVLVALISECAKPPRTQFETSGFSSANLSSACNSSTVITGKKYNVLGSGINVLQGPGASFDKIINEKATRVLEKTTYITIDDTTTVIEECTKNGWSWIRVIDPDWLQISHIGWVESRFLDKGQDYGSDKYAKKISYSALSPYTQKSYPKITAMFGSRLPEIEALRRKAAEIAVDSGKCDFVLMSELSDKSTLNHLHFWIDCKNKQRIYLDEFQIKKSKLIMTQESALAACQQKIKTQFLMPNKQDIHSLLGSSFEIASTEDNAVLRMEFDAKNLHGEKISYAAICHFVPGEIYEIELQLRE